jgi:sugar O-acyltransferase (sialic acid O-acetyltransferase NeuD family)
LEEGGVPEELIILGAGAYGEEISQIARRAAAAGAGWTVAGFLAEPRQGLRVGAVLACLPVLGLIPEIRAYPHALFVVSPQVVGRGDIGLGSRPWESLPPERLPAVVDPAAFIAISARLGSGCIIYPHAFVGAGATLGRGVVLLAGAVVNHDDDIGDGVVICANVALAGHVVVGANSYLGQSCTIRQNVHVGERAVVGMGAVVLEDVPDEAVVVGNPAIRLSRRRPAALSRLTAGLAR